MEPLRIDGSHGEGGGQIVRTSVALSCMTKRPVAICNIRANRKSPGLKAQHITTIKVLQKLCGARVEGNRMNSPELHFVPGKMRGGRLEEHVGTAGSVCLALQAAIPAMVSAGTGSELRITGGTDVPWSPTLHYMQNVVRGAFGRMGLEFSAGLARRGYYPKGGGDVVLRVLPGTIRPIRLTRRDTSHVDISCSYSKIPARVIKSGAQGIADRLRAKGCTVSMHTTEEDARDSGATILASMKDAGSVMGADSLFDKKTNSFGDSPGLLAENRLGVDENLADMLVVPASVARGTSVFCVPNITRHLETNLFVASEITGCRYGAGRIRGGYEIRIEGASDSCIH